MSKKDAKISCQVFRKQEVVIKDITNKMNKAKNVQEKVKFAEELQKEVNVLLSCQDHKDASLDCKNCHFIAALRRKTADLIVKAKKLG